jgi:L-threonylcarbamoyladenylate synthase
MPDDRIALELLEETGPLAVSSANRTGEAAAQTALDALYQLGDSIAVYLDAGATPGPDPSTIVDATALADGSGPLRILREGVITREQLEAVVPEAFAIPEAEPVEDEPEGQVVPASGTEPEVDQEAAVEPDGARADEPRPSE